MKKLLFLILVILLLPITVLAKTPTLEETLNVIRGINNVTVIDGVTIESTRVDESDIAFVLQGREEYVPYKFENNTLIFKGGCVLVDENKQVIGEIFDNAFAFFLYSILDNKSSIPYDSNNYYSTENIANMINNGFATEYSEPTNTFGISLQEEDAGKYRIYYKYHLDGDYPVFDLGSGDSFDNPATGNYNVLITIMLLAVLAIAIYSYINREKKKGV
jgi:hypothetical protein